MGFTWSPGGFYFFVICFYSESYAYWSKHTLYHWDIFPTLIGFFNLLVNQSFNKENYCPRLPILLDSVFFSLKLYGLLTKIVQRKFQLELELLEIFSLEPIFICINKYPKIVPSTTQDKKNTLEKTVRWDLLCQILKHPVLRIGMVVDGTQSNQVGTPGRSVYTQNIRDKVYGLVWEKRDELAHKLCWNKVLSVR